MFSSCCSIIIVISKIDLCFLCFSSFSKAKHILSSGDHFERNELIEEGNNGIEAEQNNSDDTVCAEYLAQAADIIRTDYVKGILVCFHINEKLLADSSYLDC